MATVMRTNPNKGFLQFSLASANDETETVPMETGDTCLITATGVAGGTGSTVQILLYSKPGATGIPLSFDGASSFTADFALNFVAAGKCFVTVKMTVDGGTVAVVITK